MSQESEERDRIHSQLTEFVRFDDGVRMRNRLRELAKTLYVPKRTPEQYMGFLRENMCSFGLCSIQSTNHPRALTMFCVAAQHQLGDCIEECLDAAMDSIENRMESHDGQ